jgi:predicted nucleic acid-binding protein
MTDGIVDTTVLVHLLRHKTDALTWFNSQTNQLSVTPISWLEIMFGAGSKARQQQGLNLLNRFDMEFLIESDMRWAMQQMQNYRLSHGIGIMDCLIASVCFRLQVPLYTHNLKHMGVLLGSKLATVPY